MVTITRWTGREARILREVALRKTIYEFAAHTHLSTSAIQDWETKGERAQLRTSTQKILDETLAGAPEDAQQRFTAALADTTDPSHDIDGNTGRSGTMGDRTASASRPAAAAGLPLPSVGQHWADGSGHVDHRLLAGYEEVAEVLATMYRSVDPRAVLSIAAAYAGELMAAYDRQEGSVAEALAVLVVGVHCQVGLWACHAHQPARARPYLATACDVAASMDDRAFHARALGSLAYLHSSAPRGGAGGNPWRALELLDRALALAATADRFTQGWLATWRADQHATLGDLVAAQADLELADAALDADDGPGAGFFARSHYGYGMRGHLDSVRGLVDALAGRLDESERVFNSVQTRAANGRRRVASSCHQALAYARASDPEAACEALERSLTMIEAEPYPMGLQRAVGVRTRFDPAWAQLPCVRTLDERLSLLAPVGVGAG